MTERKILQSYVLVEMRLTEETWFAVRNTPGVTGFVGSDQPTPVSEKEMREILNAKANVDRLLGSNTTTKEISQRKRNVLSE